MNACKLTEIASGRKNVKTSSIFFPHPRSRRPSIGPSSLQVTSRNHPSLERMHWHPTVCFCCSWHPSSCKLYHTSAIGRFALAPKQNLVTIVDRSPHLWSREVLPPSSSGERLTTCYAHAFARGMRGGWEQCQGRRYADRLPYVDVAMLVNAIQREFEYVLLWFCYSEFTAGV